MKTKLLSIAALLSATLVWGSTYVATKSSINMVDPVELLVYRFLVPALIIGLFARIKYGAVIWKNLKYGLITGGVMWLYFIFQNVGLVYTEASNSSFLTGLFIVFTPLISRLLYKDKLTYFESVVISTSLIGMWLLTGGLSDLNSGDMLSILAAVVFALYVVLSDRFVRYNKINPIIFSFQQFLVIGSASVLWTLVRSIAFSVPIISTMDTTTVSIVIYLMIFPILIAFTVLNIVQKYLESFEISIILTLNTLFGAVFAWTIGGEIATWNDFAGGLVIMISVLMPLVAEAVEEINLIRETRLAHKSIPPSKPGLVSKNK